jgi:hypothetical protein
MTPVNKRYDDKMKLDMPFAEALERYAGTDPKEMHANIAKAKQKKPPGGKHQPPGKTSAGSTENLLSLRDARVRKANRER